MSEKRKYHPRKIKAKICLQCGKKYIPNNRTIERQKYCSENCSKRYWNLSIDERTTLKKLIKENKELKKNITEIILQR